LNSYVSVAANPYPGFLGEGEYPVDVELPPPAEQNRWSIAFRFFLAIPALLLYLVIGGGGSQSTFNYQQQSGSYGAETSGLLSVGSVFAWFGAMFTKRVWPGVAHLLYFGVHYNAQTLAYLLLVSDRYPDASPRRTGVPETLPPHPVVLAGPGGPLERSRITVFFRILLAIPHFVWLTLWGIALFLATIANWLVTLFRGRSPAGLHGFAASYLRYSLHVSAFLYLAENPFPGFTGAPGTYPLEVEFAGPERQNRWKTGFRLILAFPALLLTGAMGGVLLAVGVLGWFASLITGRMPEQLRDVGLYALRYTSQAYAYLLLLTDRYPYSGPGGREPGEEPEPEPEPEPDPDLIDTGGPVFL
jgi:hypothetical protein